MLNAEMRVNIKPTFGNVGVTNALRFGRASFFNDLVTGDGVYRIAYLSTYTSAT